MQQCFEELTRQLTMMSNAEVVKCVSNLSTIVAHLSLKVSTIEARSDSNGHGRCEELCDTVTRNHKVTRVVARLWKRMLVYFK